MAALTKTRYPGVYKRGGRYSVAYRDLNGKQRWESARTLEEARALKAARQTDLARGEFDPLSRITFAEYATEWIDRYQGTGRGFRESTRDDYRDVLKRYAFLHLGKRKRLTEITPRDLANFVAWLCDEDEQGRRLADATIQNIFKPVRRCLETARAEGLIRHNPAVGIGMPHRPKIETADPNERRALTRKQLQAFLAKVDPSYKLMFQFLIATGLRIGELIALEWRHLHLDGSEPRVKVRQHIYRGRLQPPKSKYGKRDVPINKGLVAELRRYRMANGWPADDEPVFPSKAGTPMEPQNVRHRVFQPVAKKIGAPWASFHTLRHTCASMLFERGANAVQVQRWLGHHSPAFTLDTHVHLLSDTLGEPLDLRAELSANKLQTHGTQTDPNDGQGEEADSASESQRSQPTALRPSA